MVKVREKVGGFFLFGSLKNAEKNNNFLSRARLGWKLGQKDSFLSTGNQYHAQEYCEK